MSTTFRHRHGHAVVAFSNELTWSSALDRVGSIDLVVDAYFYGLVELVVSSPSGTCPALDYVLNALALRRAQGVRFRTRIISQASSVAAVLACLGDERVAKFGARLLFHRSRAVDVEEITARQMAASLGGRLVDSSDSTWLFARVAAAALEHFPNPSGEARDLLGRVLGYWQSTFVADRQYAGVRAAASDVCSGFAAPPTARTLYFGCEPGRDAGARERGALDFARAVAQRGNGPLVFFQPARDGLDTLVAVALKALFFDSVLDDPDRVRGGADLPLVGYVADEFHRFATSDPVHGEQSFLDACRSAGAFCLVACQSVASIEHALARGAGTAIQNETAVSIVWNNTASKLVFRSTDLKTAERVNELCPYQPGLAGVVRVRPISPLATGECYVVLADGRFERRRLEPFRGAGPERLRAPSGRARASRCVAENDVGS